MNLAQTKFHVACQLDEDWKWKELIYKGSALAKGAKYYLDVDLTNGQKQRRFMMTIHVHTFDKDSKKFLIDFASCELSPHGNS